MKIHYLTLYTFLMGVLLASSSCDLVKDFSYNVSPNPLEMHGDSVKFSVVVNIPQKGIRKKVKAEITPKLANTAIGTWVVQGEKVTGNGKTVPFKPGGSATFDVILPFESSFESADLKLTGKIFKGNKEKSDLKEVKIADATITTPLMVKKEFKMISDELELTKRSEDKSLEAKINFDRAKSIVKPNEIKDKDISDIIAWIRSAQSNPKITIKSIEIKGYASPDGEESRNEMLSSDRAREARTAIIGLMKKEKLTALTDTSKYVTSKFGEDFEGFKTQLAATSSITEADKSLFIRILEMSKDPKQRETEMINLGKSYQELEKDVFPAIRRTTISVNYTIAGMTDEELKATSVSNPDSLSLDELLFLASKLTKDINEKSRLYQIAIKNYPNDYRSYNNLGVVYFFQNKLADAKLSFEKSIQVKENSNSKNNLAGVTLLQGDRSNARKLINQAKGAKDANAVAYNAVILDILDGKYASGVSLKDNCFNKALAATLSNKYEDAKKALNGVSESAEVHYLKAIISSRSGEGTDAVVNHLKNAFAKDSSLKEKAAKDREFVKIFNDSSFTSAVQ
jgi:Flp pilus assembly protein TadD/outer membrane protein OmpA-like peptidoglycan-associated protein